MTDMMSTNEARDYIPQWGSMMTAGDPGAVAYGAIPPETAEHRDSLVAYLSECKTLAEHNGAPPSDSDSDDRVELARAIAYLESIDYGAALIIEICPREPRASACLADGRDVSADPRISAALADCRASGDCQPACEHVRDAIGVDFRIIARDASGAYVNRAATDAEMQATCEAIYFDSEPNEFAARDKAATYLIWEAASDAESGE